MGKKFVLFDFDGVIANTEESNGRYLEKAFSVYGITLTGADRQSLVGRRDKSLLGEFLARSKTPPSQEEFQRTRSRIGNTYENSAICPMPGLVPMIEELRADGVGTALVTSTSAKLIITALNRMQMQTMFDVIVCGDMCAESKPSPMIYQKAMELLNASPKDCIVIEDSAAGITAGKRAGAYVIAYSGSGVSQDVSQADFTVAAYDACREKIRELVL